MAKPKKTKKSQEQDREAKKKAYTQANDYLTEKKHKRNGNKAKANSNDSDAAKAQAKRLELIKEKARIEKEKAEWIVYVADLGQAAKINLAGQF